METFSALLTICAGNSIGPSEGEFPAQRPVTRSFDIFFNLRLNKRLSKQSWGWWFETLSCPLWRQCYACCFFEQMMSFKIIDVIFLFFIRKWYNLPYHVEGIHWSSVDFIHKRPQMGNFDNFVVVSLDKLLNKLLLPWCSSDVTKMINIASSVISICVKCIHFINIIVQFATTNLATYKS